MTSPLELLPNTYRAFFSTFSALTTAQKELIAPILKGEDVVLQARTGSGKTEAVLAPATEKLITHGSHFTIVYIVPTRALALDMNRRIQPIYKKLGLKSGIRTGDQKNFRDGKPHLLIMTPESLDVILGSQNQDNKYFIKHVHIIIIDEVHQFSHTDRGYHLSYLHRRIAMQSVGPVQTVTLSATIDDPKEIMEFFHLNKNALFYKQSASRKLQPHWVHIENEEQELKLFFDDLYRRSGCQKLLVFANSRKKCEQLYEKLNQEGFFYKKIYIHYSNLSTQERKSIESSFREKRIGICIATSTLELGIDIGDVDGVVLMGPPSSTMAFLQRIGRGNRREQYSNFWGVCYGSQAGKQLVRFLALFELAKGTQVEKRLCSLNYSVVFQQILSCLYAKKAISKEFLNPLFQEKSEDLHSIFPHMLEKNWLKPTNHTGLYEGGWRYFNSLKKRQIWSNFPPTDEEYDVILEEEKIASIPLWMVKQLEIGDLIQLTGKVLKILQIEEKKTAFEIHVKESEEAPNKSLIWGGFGIPTPFEVAQKMGVILLEKFTPEGLLHRTGKLLESERKEFDQSLEQPNGIRTYQLANGTYRYETFLGSIANYILYLLCKTHFSSKIEGFSVSFDEIGLESNEWISFASLEIPHTAEQLREWISSHLSFLIAGFSWNSWIHWLPEEYQKKEITSYFYDPRVLEHFQRYHSEPTWIPLPPLIDDDEEVSINQIDLKDKPWSIEDEKNRWGLLSFPKLSLEEQESPFSLTATQLQGYVKQKLCPRWARFQRLNYQIEPHPRFYDASQEIQSSQQQGITFEKQVIEALQIMGQVCFETPAYPWKEAIKGVIVNKNSLFLVQAKLKVDGSLNGTPDLIYIQYQESHICLEVWDITFSQSISYAQKWKVAFYSYLLDSLLDNEMFSLPVKVSTLGGFVSPSMEKEKLFEKTPFLLSPFRTWMPRLIAQWKTDSGRSLAIQDYSIESSCTSCQYFSYCYQETLYHSEKGDEEDHPRIISQNIESNDFPKNSKHWYFIHYDKDSLR